MRIEIGLTATVAAVLLVAACGQQSEPTMPKQPDLAPAPQAAPPAGNATAPAAPAEPAAGPAGATPAGASGTAPSDPTQKLLAELPEPYRSGDIKNGKVQFSKCMSCHTVAQGGPALTGPNLFGIFGRKSAAYPGFAYSDPMKAHNVTWDAAKIDHWIENPATALPGTKMIFVGIPSAKSRVDLIAYLKVASGGGPL